MRVRDVWLGFKRPRSCRAFSCMKSWSLVPPQATVFQALVIWEEARKLPSRQGQHSPSKRCEHGQEERGAFLRHSSLLKPQAFLRSLHLPSSPGEVAPVSGLPQM